MKILLILTFLINIIQANYECPGLYIGTAKNQFNVMDNGIWSNLWNPHAQKKERNIIRRDSEFFYVKYLGKKLDVRKSLNIPKIV